MGCQSSSIVSNSSIIHNRLLKDSIEQSQLQSTTSNKNLSKIQTSNFKVEVLSHLYIRRSSNTKCNNEAKFESEKDQKAKSEGQVSPKSAIGNPLLWTRSKSIHLSIFKDFENHHIINKSINMNKKLKTIEEFDNKLPPLVKYTKRKNTFKLSRIRRFKDSLPPIFQPINLSSIITSSNDSVFENSFDKIMLKNSLRE